MWSLRLLALSLGIICIGLLAELPPLAAALLPLLIFSGWYRFRNNWLLVLLSFALGCSWGIIHGHRLLSHALPAGLVGQELLVQGKIVDLPVTHERYQSFILEVSHLETLQGAVPASQRPRRIRLIHPDITEPLVSGARWQLLVQLKQPRGFVNPGGFDYQGWLQRRGIDATGNVRKHTRINRLLAEAPSLDIHYWRYRIRDWMQQQTDSPWLGIALALVIGDRSLILPEQWQLLQKTGTNHLIAISGMHVSFVAGLAFFIGMTLGRLLLLLHQRCSPLWLAAGFSIVAAVIYSLLAGMALPTQRAIIMILVAQLVILSRRSFRSRDGLLLAWVMVLILDPLAAYDPGLWLSFGAVATLLLSFSGYVFFRHRDFPGKSLLRAQWVIFIGLFVPLVILVHSVSLLAPLANLIAIPLVTLWVVPCLLLAALSQSVLPVISGWLLDTGLFGIELLHRWGSLLLAPVAAWSNPAIALNTSQTLLALLACLLGLLPRGLPLRWLAVPMLLLAVWLPVGPRPPLQLTFLDVGQGLAVVVTTPSRSLVYDTGPWFSERFDAGRAIVVPYLRHRGIRQLDQLVVSHNDNDHIGGLAALLEEMPVKQLLLGDTAARLPVDYPQQAISCHAFGEQQWDGVNFRFIPVPLSLRTSSNNHSCILLISYRGHSFVLTGDAENPVEEWLRVSGELSGPVTLLAAGHHGSRTSSSAAFVTALQPRWVVFSAGYQSRYGHPHRDVVARFRQVDSRMLNTATSGAVTITVNGQGGLQVREARQTSRRYWHTPPGTD